MHEPLDLDFLCDSVVAHVMEWPGAYVGVRFQPATRTTRNSSSPSKTERYAR